MKVLTIRIDVTGMSDKEIEELGTVSHTSDPDRKVTIEVDDEDDDYMD